MYFYLSIPNKLNSQRNYVTFYTVYLPNTPLRGPVGRLLDIQNEGWILNNKENWLYLLVCKLV
jgi:hypothetical protein